MSLIDTDFFSTPKDKEIKSRGCVSHTCFKLVVKKLCKTGKKEDFYKAQLTL